jgi:hypothetical protein
MLDLLPKAENPYPVPFVNVVAPWIERAKGNQAGNPAYLYALAFDDLTGPFDLAFLVPGAPDDPQITEELNALLWGSHLFGTWLRFTLERITPVQVKTGEKSDIAHHRLRVRFENSEFISDDMICAETMAQFRKIFRVFDELSPTTQEAKKTKKADRPISILKLLRMYRRMRGNLRAIRKSWPR